jgi:hypothetical protein
MICSRRFQGLHKTEQSIMATFYRASLYTFGLMTLTALCTLAIAYVVKPPGEVVGSLTVEPVAVYQLVALHPVADIRAAVRETIRDGCRKCGKQANADFNRSNQVGQPWRIAADLYMPPDAVPWRA